MSKTFWIFLMVGLVAVTAIVGTILYGTRDARVELRGSIQKVRVFSPDTGSTIAIVDFRFANPGSNLFVVRRVDVVLEGPGGERYEGQTVAEIDARRLFEYYPALGQKFNETLRAQTKVRAGESMDRMVAARFDAPEQAVASRRQLTIRVVDVDGPVTEIKEK